MVKKWSWSALRLEGVGTLDWRRAMNLKTACIRWAKTRSTRRTGVPKNHKVGANVPIDPRKRDPYCDDRTSGTLVSRIAATVQITVGISNFSDWVNSSANLASLNDRIS